MSFVFTSIAIFVLISIAYENKAADVKTNESAIQGKQINLYHHVFLLNI